jgi:hypothetical protein
MIVFSLAGQIAETPPRRENLVHAELVESILYFDSAPC